MVDRGGIGGLASSDLESELVRRSRRLANNRHKFLRFLRNSFIRKGVFLVAFNMGMGKPAVPDKRVPRVWVWYQIWHTQAKLRTRGAVSRVRAGIYSINLLEVYEFICT